MAGNGSSDLGQVVARVSERVENQGREIGDIRSNMNTGFANTNANFQALSNELRAQTAALNSTIAERNKTPWAILITGAGLLLATMGGLGTLTIAPMVNNIAAVTTELKDMKDKVMTRSELDYRAGRSLEDRNRMQADIAAALPMKVWEERNHARDQEIMGLQKQIDANRVDFQTFASSMGNGRDIIQDLKDELARQREAIAQLRAEKMGGFQ